jgi:hypothetical protein
MNSSSYVLVDPFHNNEMDVVKFRCELCYYIHIKRKLGWVPSYANMRYLITSG